MNKIEIYKVVTYENKLEYFLYYGNSRYEVVRCFDWGVVSNHWISGSWPLEFIRGQHGSVNAATTTGINLIQRIKYENLPKLVRKLLSENNT